MCVNTLKVCSRPVVVSSDRRGVGWLTIKYLALVRHLERKKDKMTINKHVTRYQVTNQTRCAEKHANR